MSDPKILIIDGPGPSGGEWREGWTSAPLADAGYDDGSVVISSRPALAGATVETHQIREAVDGDACCRCADPILAGSMVHAVTVTAPDGTVTHRQATHLHHLRG